MELLDYGFKELEKNMESILDGKPSTPYELRILTFNDAHCSGTLTHDRQIAFDEIFKNYTLNDIFKFLDYKGNKLSTLAEVATEETIHALLCEAEFEKFIREQVNHHPLNIVKSGDVILIVIVELINDGVLDVNINDFPKLKEVKETYF